MAIKNKKHIIPYHSISCITKGRSEISIRLLDDSVRYMSSDEYNLDEVWSALSSCLNNGSAVCNLDGHKYGRK